MKRRETRRTGVHRATPLKTFHPRSRPPVECHDLEAPEIRMGKGFLAYARNDDEGE